MSGASAAELVAPRRWPAASPGGLRSAVYRGTLIHQRFGPGPEHSFSYRVAMPLVDLDEVDELAGLHPLVSAHRPAPVRFRRDDFLGPPDVPLDRAVRDLVEARTGRRPGGAVALLSSLRTWGWLFNPISLYFCGNGDGTGVEALVAEVQNTPWHERTAYVVGGPGEYRFAKALHVSPFLPMDLDYRLRYRAPGDRLAVVIDVMRGRQRLFSARLTLRRHAADRRALGSLVWSVPAMTHRVSAGIYTQAARLRLKGAPFHPHPDRTPAGPPIGPDPGPGEVHRRPGARP